jgi:uncharacterized flavoprotein (TIGR03862 family)
MAARLRIAIIGGGPAGMMAADMLATHAEVDLYEHGKHIGRKFLVAGQGGFNLTNKVEGDELLHKYSPAGFLDHALNAFGPAQLRTWLNELGIVTFIGTSGRVFPVKGIKPIDVLARIREHLMERGVRIHLEHAFTGFNDAQKPVLENRYGPFTLDADRVIFALGGASWPVTGSTGIWPQLFNAIGIFPYPFGASNCGVEIAWPENIVKAHAGKALKNILVSAGDRSALGEATITAHGLEGNAIYPVVPALREALNTQGEGVLRIDLKPGNTTEELVRKIGAREPRNFAEAVHLDRAQLAMLKAFTSKERSGVAGAFAADLKDLHLPVSGLRPIGEAISTVGGIRCKDLSSDFSFKRHPHLFAIGEMVDWDAPTGGFLLHGCFAMGRHAALSVLGNGECTPQVGNCP